MAVDKNFVVRNGLEVNSDLIVTDTSDSSNKKVGIASTGPRVTLDVRGGIAATDLNITGVATLASVDISSYGRISGATQIDATSLNVTGITTLANVAIENINISGVATFADITYDEITGRNLNLTGIATIPSQANLNVTGIATIPTLNGITAFTDLNGTNATVGVATVTTANVTTLAGFPNFSGGVTVAGVSTFSGQINAGTAATIATNGNASFSGIVTASQFQGGGIGVGIKTSGGTIGFGFTTLNFIGSGNTFAVNGTTVDISIAGGGGGGGGSASIGIGTTVGDAFSGIVTAGNLWYNTGEGRLFIYFQDATSAQWIDAAPFNVGIITTLQDVAFAAGSAAAPAISFDTDSDSGFFQAALNQPGVSAAGSQVARFNPGGLDVTGVVTATTFSGNATGLTGTPDVTVNNVTAGVITATSYNGDGSQLTGRGVGIQSGGTLVAYGATIVNFVGSGASVRDLGSNTVEVLVSGGGGGGSIGISSNSLNVDPSKNTFVGTGITHINFVGAGATVVGLTTAVVTISKSLTIGRRIESAASVNLLASGLEITRRSGSTVVVPA